MYVHVQNRIIRHNKNGALSSFLNGWTLLIPLKFPVKQRFARKLSLHFSAECAPDTGGLSHKVRKPQKTRVKLAPRSSTVNLINLAHGQAMGHHYIVDVVLCF